LNNLRSIVAIWPVSPPVPPIPVVTVGIVPAVIPVTPVVPSVAPSVSVRSASVVSHTNVVIFSHVVTANSTPNF